MPFISPAKPLIMPLAFYFPLQSLFWAGKEGVEGDLEVGTLKMASQRPKSPRPNTPKKDEANESFWDKIGTLGRKKKIKEGKDSSSTCKHTCERILRGCKRGFIRTGGEEADENMKTLAPPTLYFFEKF